MLQGCCTAFEYPSYVKENDSILCLSGLLNISEENFTQMVQDFVRFSNDNVGRAYINTYECRGRKDNPREGNMAAARTTPESEAGRGDIVE